MKVVVVVEVKCHKYSPYETSRPGNDLVILYNWFWTLFVRTVNTFYLWFCAAIWAMLVSGRQWPWRCHLQPGPGQRDTMEANFTIQHILNSLLEFISYWTCFTASLPGSVSMSWSCSQWQSSLCQPSNNRMCCDCFALNLWRILLFCAWFWG